MPSANQLVSNFINTLSLRLAGVTNEGPEAQLADLVPNLLRGLAQLQGRTEIDLRGQAHEKAVGVPDFSIKDGLLLIGHVETKPPGAGASTSTFKGHDREQWQRFSKLPNVLYTDGYEWALYRSGVRDGPLLKLSFPAVGKQIAAADDKDVGKLSALVARTFGWKAVPPASLTALAEALAPLCAVLRAEVRGQLANDQSQVWKAADELRSALFPEQTDDQVADAIAQLCTYSMLLARSRGTSSLSAAGVEASLAQGHPVLARAVRVILDEETEAEVGWALDTVRTLIEVVDFDALRGGTPLPGMTHHDQTWLYFYEAFLAAYDPKLRDAYGVYYTPQPVISAMTALLDEILRTRLGKSQGFASPGVTVLDPAAGTGSFPLRIIERAAASAADVLGQVSVPGVVTGLASNLYAFEVLVGPYSVAHLRISEMVSDFQASLPAEGPQVFLTDTLSSPHADPTTLARLFEPLVEEQRRAIAVKERTNILVCIGNPPYERRAALGAGGEQHGHWVVHGDEQTEAAPLLEAFLGPANKHTKFSHVASLYNEYVFFWRWALWKVFESPFMDGRSADDPGVVAFISASSFLSGPGFLGMREHLRRLCDEIWVIDLGGEGRGTRKEENVFVIQTPVAITVALRAKEPDMSTPATVRYTRVTGTQDEKLSALASIGSLNDLEWNAVPDGWHDPLRPAGAEVWERWPKVTDLFPWQFPGVKANRTWPIAPLRLSLEQRWDRLAGASSDADRALCFANPKTSGRRHNTKLTAGAFPPPTSNKTIAELTPKDPRGRIERYAFRPFDRQWVVADPRVLALQRPPLWYAHGAKQVYMSGFFTGVLGMGPAVVASAEVPDLHVFRGSFGGKDVIPLWRDAAATEPNVTAGLLDAWSARLGVSVTAEDLFAYAYAVLSSPSYVERFWDELEQPQPRLPITTDAALFEDATRLGRRLLSLHTYGQRFGGLEGAQAGPGRAKLVRAVTSTPMEPAVWDAESEQLRIGDGVIEPVSEEVWSFSVSGYEVVPDWLRWRMREPVGKAKSSRSPLDHIRPTAWPTEYTVELLELLWMLERTQGERATQMYLIEKICASETLLAADLPQPTSTERTEPKPPKPAKPPKPPKLKRGRVLHEQQGGLDV